MTPTDDCGSSRGQAQVPLITLGIHLALHGYQSCVCEPFQIYLLPKEEDTQMQAVLEV